MMRKQVWIASIAIIGAVILGIGWLISLRSKPAAWALLDLMPPDAEVYAVADLEALQSNPAVRRLLADPPRFSYEEEYRQLLRSTGFRYQDDLKQFSVAKLGEDWIGAARVEADRPRIIAYLESQGAAKSLEENQTVYTFGSVRPFRLVFLDDHLVAFTAGGDSSHLRQVLERHAGKLADSGATELRQSGEFMRLPAGSELWIFGRLDRLLEKTQPGLQLGPFQLGREFLQGSRTLSVAVESSPIQLEIRAEDRCDSAASAERIANWVQPVLAILRSSSPASRSSGGRDLTPLWAALSVRHAGESVFLEWRWSPAMLTLLERTSP